MVNRLKQFVFRHTVEGFLNHIEHRLCEVLWVAGPFGLASDKLHLAEKIGELRRDVHQFRASIAGGN
jgi:hypothetical protein